jgi:hypothetical protein
MRVSSLLVAFRGKAMLRHRLDYVLQRALTVVDGEQKDFFFNDVKSMLAVLRKSTTTYYRPLVSSRFLL